MIELLTALSAPAVLFLDVPLGATTATERLGVVFRPLHRRSHPRTLIVILFWDEIFTFYRRVEVPLAHIIRPVDAREIRFRESMMTR